MPVIQTYEPDHNQLILSIKPSLWGGNSALQKVELLYQALEIIRAGAWQDDPKRTIWYVPIDLGNNHKAGREFDPWQTSSTSAWMKLFSDKALRPKLREWLKLVANTVPHDGHRREETVREDDQTQLGEVPAYLFAMEDRSSIEDLHRLQLLWDYEHLGERAIEAGSHLIKKHGFCKETEPMVDSELRFDPEGMHRQITEGFGTACNYEPFRALVSEFNEAFKKAKPEQYQAIILRLRTDSTAPVGGRAEERRLNDEDNRRKDGHLHQNWPRPWPRHPDIIADMDTVLAVLDAIELAKD